MVPWLAIVGVILIGVCATAWFLRSRKRPQEEPYLYLLEKRPGGPPEPIVAQERWHEIPGWIKLDWFRGTFLPKLESDPLFWGKGDPCLMPFKPGPNSSKGRGVAILVPGGNYEFLTPQEGPPIANLLVEKLGIPVYLLRYRLLPTYGLDDMLEDLRAGMRKIRELSPGEPIVGMGMSSGTHLIACFNAEGADGADSGSRAMDAQVFLYPMIDAQDWQEQGPSGFWNVSVESPQVRGLLRSRERLLKGDAFVPPPPTFIAGSTGDNEAPPSRHSDVYCAAMRAAKVPHEYMKGDYGGHGFSHQDFWRQPLWDWLAKRGFGPAEASCDKRD